MGCDLTELHVTTIPMSFNPRTHMGCDLRLPKKNLRLKSFNPRTHMGCDCHDLVVRVYGDNVSIHAPTWGATPDIGTSWEGYKSFNPRTHMGCDSLSLRDYYRLQFQSTHPHGVRQDEQFIYCFRFTFQSTHPHGVRRLCRRLRSPVFVFQSTHPHGVRLRYHS